MLNNPGVFMEAWQEKHINLESLILPWIWNVAVTHYGEVFLGRPVGFLLDINDTGR